MGYRKALPVAIGKEWQGFTNPCGSQVRVVTVTVGVGELKPQENLHPQQGFDGFSGVSDR